MSNLNKLRIASTALALAVVLGWTGTTRADGTQAGTIVTNTASVDYEVGGVPQATIVDSVDFTVDRKIDLTVVTQDVAYVAAATNQLQAILTFRVTNTGNDTLDFRLSAQNEATATVEPVLGGTDDVDGAGIVAFHDVDSSGTFNAGDRLYVDELGIDAFQDVLVAVDMPAVALNGDELMISLIALAREGGLALTEGAAIVADVAPEDPNTEETIFIDAAGDADAVADAQHSDMWAFTLLSAALTVTKTELLISDPFNGVVNPFHIPGAVVEYTITLANAVGGSDATALDLTDVIPGNTTYVAGSITLDAAVQGDGTGDGDPSDFNVTAVNSVSVLGLTVTAGGADRVITFRVTLD